MSFEQEKWAAFEEALSAAHQPDPSAEIAFYAQLFARPGLNLEVGFQDGRRLLSLLELGIRVHGLESEAWRVEHLLGRAESRGLVAKLFVEKLESFELAEAYDTVLLNSTVLSRLRTTREHLACCAAVHRSLKRGGQLVVDAGHEELVSLLQTGDGQRRCLHNELLDPVRDQHFAWYREARAELSEQLARVSDIVECFSVEGRLIETWRRQTTRRMIFRYEFEHLLARSGFRITARYGDLDKSPLGPSAPRLFLVARRVER